MRRLSFMSVLVLLTAIGVGAQSAGLRELRHVKRLGEALVEYNDGQIQAVAAYYYSQRRHAGPWLLVEFALAGRQPAIVRRTEIALVTPSGRTVPLADQRRWGGDVSGRQLLQEARIQRHQLRQYFRGVTGSDEMRFFGRPERAETVIGAMQTGPDQVMYGDLMFSSPTGAWDPGRYVLVVEHDGGAVQLPIDLR